MGVLLMTASTMTRVSQSPIDIMRQISYKFKRHRLALPSNPPNGSFMAGITRNGKSAMSKIDSHRPNNSISSTSDSVSLDQRKLLLDDKTPTTITRGIPPPPPPTPPIIASAPGKFILSGEYSVVYGKHAVAVSIDLRTTVYVRPNNNDSVRIDLKNIKHVRSWSVGQLKNYKLVPTQNAVLDYNDGMLDNLKPLMDNCYISSGDSISNEQQQKQGDRAANSTNYLDYLDRGEEIVEKCGHDAVVAFLLLYIGITDSYSSSSRPAIDVIVESQLPVGCGLGSSSAYSVALCGALMRLAKATPSERLEECVSRWAFSIDKYFHRTPSGIDNNIIAHGGSILFHRGQIKQHLKRPMTLTSILVDTCVTRSTKTLIDKVACRLNDPQFNSQELFNQIDDITLAVWNELTSDQFTMGSMDALLIKNQQMLDKLGVGHQALSDIIDSCSQYGYCAKMTGAGGGGIAFLLVANDQDENLAELRSVLTKKGYKHYDTHIGGHGLQVS